MDIEELAKKRLEICKSCPLWLEDDYGPVCNNKKWINPEGKASWLPLEGYKQGCNCRLYFKVRKRNAHCVVNLW